MCSSLLSGDRELAMDGIEALGVGRQGFAAASHSWRGCVRRRRSCASVRMGHSRALGRALLMGTLHTRHRLFVGAGSGAGVYRGGDGAPDQR